MLCFLSKSLGKRLNRQQGIPNPCYAPKDSLFEYAGLMSGPGVISFALNGLMRVMRRAVRSRDQLYEVGGRGSYGYFFVTVGNLGSFARRPAVRN